MMSTLLLTSGLLHVRTLAKSLRSMSPLLAFASILLKSTLPMPALLMPVSTLPVSNLLTGTLEKPASTHSAHQHCLVCGYPAFLDHACKHFAAL